MEPSARELGPYSGNSSVPLSWSLLSGGGTIIMQERKSQHAWTVCDSASAGLWECTRALTHSARETGRGGSQCLQLRLKDKKFPVRNKKGGRGCCCLGNRCAQAQRPRAAAGGLQMACVSSALGTSGPESGRKMLGGGRSWRKAFFPLGRLSHPFVSCCPTAKLLLAVVLWLVGVAGARNYLPGKNPTPRSS